MRTRLADVRAVCRITRKYARKSQTKSQRDPISDRVEQRQATEQQFRANQATSSRIFGFTHRVKGGPAGPSLRDGFATLDPLTTPEDSAPTRRTRGNQGDGTGRRPLTVEESGMPP